MKRRYMTVLLSFLLLLTGCWDQRELRNIRMVHTAGVDLLNENKVRLTVSIPTVKTSIEQQGKVITPKISAEGRSVQEASIQLQKMVSQHMDLRETRVLLINKKFAEKSLYEALDFFYREAHFPISVFIAITDGTAHDVVQLNVEDRSMISEYLYDLLVSSEQEGFIPKESPFLISSIMKVSGFDNVLPFISLRTGKERVKIDGVALFHEKQMTGKLDDLHARAFVMLATKKSYGSITEPIGPRDTYVTLSFKRSRHKVELTFPDNKVTADIFLTLDCTLMDNPSGEPLDKPMIDSMSLKLEKLLNDRAEETIRQLQQANCDGLSIGLQMKARHNRKWEKLDWNQEYPKINIKPHIQVKIENHGLLN
ncbi:Ger(x)C family spore germination protein [Paenibacillus plantarum]|nr:Ger(x)C family spore germination protein [Paenibacillus plantarum]